MDGNRRFAKKLRQDKKVGHMMGWIALESALEWCLQLGIKVVTIYAFSIENFKRDPDEVSYLFEMMIEKFAYFATQNDFVERHQIRIRVMGDVSMLPIPVQRAAYEVERSTRHNHGAILNICIPYTARHEMREAVMTVRRELAMSPGGAALEDACDVSFLTRAVEAALQTASCPPVDILLRTSGEHRLSDFLLWQVVDRAQLAFVDASWPEFAFHTFLPTLLDYQLKRLAAAPLGSAPPPPPPPVLSKRIPWDPSRYSPQVLLTEAAIEGGEAR
ncbi:cis-prenyltransferase [Blastocladiella emersonii ATCC 22665]|nr:cis-prenyltransferase [Blastocladiella emersonii ATCC 22665]